MYDADTHVWEEREITAGSLVSKYGHQTEVIENSSIVNAGSTPNKLEYLIYAMENGVKVYKTHNYEITAEYGTLTVTPRPLWIETASDEFTYDGKDHEFNEKFTYKIQSDNGVDYLDIVGGHALIIDTRVFNEVLFDGSGYENANVTSGDNSLVSWDIAGTDKANYTLKVTDGKIKVKRRPIKVTTNSNTKEYDGKELKDNGVKYDNLCDNHSIGAAGTVPSITNAGTLRNEFAVRIVNIDSENPDLTRNYDIAYEYGTLTVTPRNLYVRVLSHSWEYDGQAHYGDEAEFFHADKDGNIIDGFGLLGGDEHEYESVTQKIYITNVWESGLENYYEYKIKDGNADVTKNYAFKHTEKGTLSVTPRPLNIERLSEKKEYDGTPLYGTKFSLPQLSNYDNKLVSESHKIEPIEGKITVIVNVSTVSLTTEYKVTCKDEPRINENYKIFYYNEYSSFKHLSITYRTICVITPSASKVYDDTPLTAESGETAVHLNEDGNVDGKPAFVLGHKLKLVSKFGGITHVGQTANGNNVLEYTVVAADGSQTVPSNGKDYIINNNYNITYEYGTLTVTKRPLKVTTGSNSKTYDDNYIGIPAPASVEEENAQTKRGLIAGQELKFIVGSMEDFRDALTKTNTANYTVHYVGATAFDYNGGDISEDYELEYEFGTLEIKKKDLHINTGGDTWEYDSIAHSADYTQNGSIEGLLEFHEAKADGKTVTYITDAGTKTNSAQYKIFGDALNPDNIKREVTENYNITYTFGTLTVTPRNVKIYVSDDDTLRSGKNYVWEYNGKAHYNDTASVIHYYENADGEWEEDGKAGLVGDHVAVAQGNRISVTDVTDGTKINIYGYLIYAAEIDLPDIWDDDAIDAARNKTGNYNIIDIFAGSIKIAPRKIRIVREKSEKVYDGDPLEGLDYRVEHVGDDGLPALVLAEHSLRPMESTVTKITDVLESTEYTGITVTTEYEVYEGNAFSYNYNIAHTGTPEITVTPRPITVLTDSETKPYDGTPLVKYSWKITEGNLVKDHELLHDTDRFSAKVTYVHEGKAENELHFKIMSGEDSKYFNYALTVNYGTLEITPRVLYISPEYCEHTYNGEIFEYKSGFDNFEYLTDDENHRVVSGESLEIFVQFRKDGEVTPPENAGNYFIFITGYATADGMQNYEIARMDELNIPFTVHKRSVRLTPRVSDRQYDGTAYDESGEWEYVLGENTPEENKVIEGDGLKIIAQYLLGDIVLEPINAGTYAVRIIGYTTVDGMQNYNITGELARLEILRRKVISVTPQKVTETYGKQPVTVKGFNSEGENGEFGIVENDAPHIKFDYEYFTESGLPISAPINAGKYKARAAMADNVSEIFLNYDFTQTEYLYGEIEISKKQVVIRAVDSKYKYYDGEAASYATVTELNDGVAYYLLGGTVYDGDELYFSVAFEGTVIRADGTSEFVSSNSVSEVARYLLIIAPDSERNANYDITVNDVASYFEIRKLFVSVTTAGGEFTYNGETVKVASEGNTQVTDEVAEVMRRLGHTVVESGGSGLDNACDAGVYTNDRNVSIIKKLSDGSEQDVSHNYDIVANFGVVTINKATVTVRVQMSSYGREYNGNPFEIAEPQASGFMKDHGFANAVWERLVNAGTYSDYSLESYDIVDSLGGFFSEYGNALKDNYVLEYELTPVVITPRVLAFAANPDNGREFNGSEFELAPAEFIGNLHNVVSSDILTVEYRAVLNGSAARIYDAGDYIVTLTGVRVNGVSVLDENSNYVLENSDMLAGGQFALQLNVKKYGLAGHGVTLAVNKREKAFDGYELFGKDGDLSFENLPEGFKFAGAGWSTSVLYPGDRKENRPDGLKIYSAAGADNSHNFDFTDFTYTAGDLFITDTAMLSPYNAGKEAVYSGAEHFGTVEGTVNNSGRLTFTAEIDGVTLNGSELTAQNKRVLNAGDYVITYKNVRYFLNGVEYTGTLNISNDCRFTYKITKRAVTVSPETDSVELEYNGSSKANALVFGNKTTGAVDGHVFELTQIKRSMKGYSEKTFDRVSDRLEAEVPLSVSAFGVYAYSGGKMFDSYGIDVSSNYEIEFENKTVRISFNRIAAQVNVTRRPAGIDSAYKYTGTERNLYKELGISDASFFTASGLYGGHVAEVGAVTLTVRVGLQPRWLTVKVKDGAGNDVSALYAIAYDYAENTAIEVEKAQVTISGESVWVNGNKLSAYAFKEHVVDRDPEGLFIESDRYVYYKLSGEGHYVRIDREGGSPVFISITVRLDSSGLRHYTVRSLNYGRFYDISK